MIHLKEATFDMFNWFSKKKPASPLVAATTAAPASDDKLYEDLTLVFRHAATQFMQMGLVHSDETDGGLAATNEAIFSDSRLQGILFGLCKSLEIRHPQLKQPKELMEIYGTLIMKLAGKRVALLVYALSNKCMSEMDRGFTEGTVKGYGEGLTIQSLQKHDLVLRDHLRHLIGSAIKTRTMPAAAPARGDPASTLSEQAGAMLSYVMEQFVNAGADERDATTLSDPYLQGILFGLCKSLDVKNPKLKEANELMRAFASFIGMICGRELTPRVIQSSTQHMRDMDREFMEGSAKGYGEGLTVQSLQTNELVLLKHLQRLTGNA